MFKRYVRSEPFIARRCAPILALIGFLLVSAVPLRAQKEVPVTVGAGLQSSFVHTAPSGSDSTDQFQVNSIRLYVNGTAADNIKFMFNTEYDGATNKVG